MGSWYGGVSVPARSSCCFLPSPAPSVTHSSAICHITVGFTSTVPHTGVCSFPVVRKKLMRYNKLLCTVSLNMTCYKKSKSGGTFLHPCLTPRFEVLITLDEIKTYVKFLVYCSQRNEVKSKLRYFFLFFANMIK